MNREYKNILVGIDGGEQALAVLKKAVEVARRNNGKVYIASVIDQQFYNSMGYAPIDQNLVDQQTGTTKQVIEECREYGKFVDYINIEGIIAYGSACESMAAKLPKKYAVDLITVGQSGLNVVERFMIGSVASYVIRHSPCGVLIISDEEEQPSN